LSKKFGALVATLAVLCFAGMFVPTTAIAKGTGFGIVPFSGQPPTVTAWHSYEWGETVDVKIYEITASGPTLLYSGILGLSGGPTYVNWNADASGKTYEVWYIENSGDGGTFTLGTSCPPDVWDATSPNPYP
jgi:hypothetical protein